MLNEKARIFVDTTTPFQRVTIADLPKYGKCLFLDGDLQSAEIDQTTYHSALVEPAFRYNPNVKRALILGGGEGATARRILSHEGVEHVTMVDIDEQVVTICEQHLPEWHGGAFGDPRISIHYEDAAKFIRLPKKPYDLIVWDLTDPYRWGDKDATPASSLYTRDSFDLLKDNLSRNGLLSIEYAYRNRYLVAPLLRDWKKISRRNVFLPSFEEKWIFALFAKPQSD